MYKETLLLLKNRPVTLTFEEIGKETKLSISWLKAFRAEVLKNPSYFRIEKLHTFLKGYNAK